MSPGAGPLGLIVSKASSLHYLKSCTGHLPRDAFVLWAAFFTCILDNNMDHFVLLGTTGLQGIMQMAG